MNRSNLPCILCVDDEPRVTEGLALLLRRDYRAVTAAGGQAALEKIKEVGAPAVILSDMRMPGMDGTSLLKAVKRLYPETTRILLTGEPGRDAAISAINEGQIFRFLTKPCAPDKVLAAIEAGVTHPPGAMRQRLPMYGRPTDTIASSSSTWPPPLGPIRARIG
jgi:DNA-binding NtrC family response regulator